MPRAGLHKGTNVHHGTEQGHACAERHYTRPQMHSLGLHQPQSPKRKKKPQNFFFGPTSSAKMGSAKKKSEIFFLPTFAHFCPFLPILDAAAKFLLIINSKHPTQKLGFCETLESARYISRPTGVPLRAFVSLHSPALHIHVLVQSHSAHSCSGAVSLCSFMLWCRMCTASYLCAVPLCIW